MSPTMGVFAKFAVKLCKESRETTPFWRTASHERLQRRLDDDVAVAHGGWIY
jgi:hypothetical protein